MWSKKRNPLTRDSGDTTRVTGVVSRGVRPIGGFTFSITNILNQHLKQSQSQLRLTLVRINNMPASEAETKEAFALFDKKGTGTISRESLGDLLRALGQNPTQAEVAELAASAPHDIDFATFSAILNRPGGFSPAGTAEDFIRGFRVFDKAGNGYIGAGELRYVLTSLGEKLSDEEVDELMKCVQIGACVVFFSVFFCASKVSIRG
ncbi:hypothetical protein PGTUg99_004032 [Puccinia graminis f. sp. tritici]|uniref:EF-hand domain-containing protein n=1 Tax=Puccinia graminis f. sp. tritici TaxID=56615 RepID=A0A5B0S776_PUCGR|nr:hypothetical protein PGTUg99_004032 [Puccinia graminis f. sp. tritici]